MHGQCPLSLRCRGLVPFRAEAKEKKIPSLIRPIQIANGDEKVFHPDGNDSFIDPQAGRKKEEPRLNPLPPPGEAFLFFVQEAEEIGEGVN